MVTTEYINPRLIRLIKAIGTETLTRRGICGNMELRARKNLWDKYMIPAMALGYVRMLYPESPNTPDQAYLLTQKGLEIFNTLKENNMINL